MYNFLKNIANDNNWIFEYGRSDYKNLVDDIKDETVYLFVDPIQTDSKFSDSGNESKTFSGRFMLLVSSDIDETYTDKYNDYIKPLLDTGLQQIKNEIACSDYQINSFKTTEVINLFDGNLDGVLVNYNFLLIE